jgi:hypothetical protein
MAGCALILSERTLHPRLDLRSALDAVPTPAQQGGPMRSPAPFLIVTVVGPYNPISAAILWPQPAIAAII